MAAVSLAEFKAMLKDAIADAMSNAMPQMIKEQETIAAYDVVYSAYENPTIYERGYSSGGVADQGLMETKSGKTYVTVTNKNEHAVQVEEGFGWDFPYLGKFSSGDFRIPRPFVLTARNNIEGGDLHTEVLKNVLISHGFNVE